MEIQPFEVRVGKDVLEDLHRRLARTRWPDEISGAGWDYGSALAYIKELAAYWRTQFDWTTQEEAINSYPHFRALVDDLWVHFIHQKGAGPNSFPIIISHGWPGSICEMLKLIPLLSDPASYGGDPADSFDVVVPSLPGYGFSDRPKTTGMNNFRIAEMWQELMVQGLGYRRFGAQGGDWGGMISSRLGFAFPQEVAGVHLNLVTGVPPYREPGQRELTPAEQEFLRQAGRWLETEGGYFHIQRTKPQTLSYSLNDSPAGLAAWIVEKFRRWSDCEGDVEKSFTKDELLTNIMVYWATQTINSSARHYYENRVTPWRFKVGERVEVPCAVAVFPKELSLPPREWAERTHNVQRWTEMPRGGHFAALEEPELLAGDIRAFFRPLR